MVFQWRTKRCDYNFYIGNKKIDIVHLPANSNSFTLSLERLKKRLFMLCLVWDNASTSAAWNHLLLAKFLTQKFRLPYLLE